MILGRIKSILLAIAGVALPILYILGRKDGANLEQREALKEAVETEKERADFYKAMDEFDNEIKDATPRDRADIAERLRQHGL